MVKIKQKKQLNLPQLIEWAWDNDIKNECFRRLNRGPFEYVWVNEDSNIEFDDDILCRKNDIFEIVFEEEIMEDTELDLVLRFIAEDKAYYTNPQTMSINTCLEAERDDVTKTHFYIENDERELVLIWRDGKMVE